MSYSLSENARAVLLPAFDGVDLSEATRRFLGEGGVSILLGESRAEYVARRMTNERRAAETPETFQKVTGEARTRAGLLLAAVDQEMGGICRLHGLVPPFPETGSLAEASPESIENLCHEIAAAAASMGVNVFLSPILDALEGENLWLQGRTWSTDPKIVAALSTAYIRGVQAAGVAATGKHFPGFRSTTGDPATDAVAVSRTSLDAIEAGLLPFREAISAGVEMVMVGPAPVVALDADKAALRSTRVVSKLKRELGFAGIVMADDLDSQATMRGDSVVDVAFDALNAGCDFLLLADVGGQLDEVATAIAAAAAEGTVDAGALAASADKVRALAQRYAT